VAGSPEGSSSIGRAPVSKTGGCGFESLLPCSQRCCPIAHSRLKKVAWPTRKEVINSSLVVLIAVVVMTALIFGFDYLSGKFVLFLFD
jgi:preprotein translocase SecE subunit